MYLIGISVLKAINEDNPAVPALLTDYILKGIFKFASNFCASYSCVC